jgi:hypothetical protein
MDARQSPAAHEVHCPTRGQRCAGCSTRVANGGSGRR